MGCIASIGAPELLLLNGGPYDCLKAKIEDCNRFYENCRYHMRSILVEEEKIDRKLTELLGEAKSSGSLNFKLAESYLYIILFILHKSQVNEAAFNIMFSNYIPGLLVNEDLLPQVILKRYTNLKELCEMMPLFFDEMSELSNCIISDIVRARDEIPREMLRIAKENPEISMYHFASIEKDWIDNIEIIGGIGKRLDQVFKNAKSCLVLANKVIAACNENREELKRILDHVDDWNYIEIPKRIQESTYEFIRKYLGITD